MVLVVEEVVQRAWGVECGRSVGTWACCVAVDAGGRGGDCAFLRRNAHASSQPASASQPASRLPLGMDVAALALVVLDPWITWDIHQAVVQSCDHGRQSCCSTAPCDLANTISASDS